MATSKRDYNMSLRILILLILAHVSTAFVVNKNLQSLAPPRSRTIQPQQQRDLVSSSNKQQSQNALSVFTDTHSSSLLLTAAEQSLSLGNVNVWIFIAGLIPFGWATIEFWRRIAVGEPFGTGSDSVFIGKENSPEESRGRQVLDRGAFLVAYLLFGIAAAAIGITLFSVVTSPPMDL